MPADVLAEHHQLAVGGEQPGRVQPAGAVEAALGRAQPVRQLGEQRGRHGERVVRDTSNGDRVRTASMLALPHTPHELVV